MHDEIGHFKRGFAFALRHKIALDWYRLPVLFETEALHRLLNQRVRTLTSLKNDVQLFEWRASRYLRDKLLQDLGNRRHRPVILHKLGIDRDDRP